MGDELTRQTPGRVTLPYLLRPHAPKLNITCSMFNLFDCVRKSSLGPPPPSSSNSPRAKGNATPTLMGGIPLCSTPHHRPHSRHVLSLGPSPLAPSRVALPPPTPLALPPLALPALHLSISLTLTPSPSPLTHTLPRLSSFSFLLHSRSVSVTLTLASRASLDLPPSPSRVASPLVLFARRVFCFSRPPPSPCPRHSGVSAPPPRLKLSSTSTPTQLRRQIRYVQSFIFLMTSD